MDGLTGFQKGILLLLIAVVLVFSVVYVVTISRKGFEYMDSIFVPHEENGGIVYAGKINNQPASFTVSADNAVTFRYDTQVFGPYTMREDPTAVPGNVVGSPGKGFALYRGEALCFRGAYVNMGSYKVLYDANGEPVSEIIASGNGGYIVKEPSISTLVHLIEGPELTHKGTAWGWILGVLFAIFTAGSVLFADALFRLWLAFRIDDPDSVEPSDWEMARRTMGWITLLVCTVVVFVMGLQ